MKSKKSTTRKFQVGDIVTTPYTKSQKSRVLAITRITKEGITITTIAAGEDSFVPVGHKFTLEHDRGVTLISPASKLSKVLA